MCRSFCSGSCGSPIVTRWRRNGVHCASRCGGDRYSSAGARVRWRAGTRNAMVHRCQHPGDAPGCWCCCWGAKGISVAHPEPVRRSIARAVARGATTAVAAHNCAGLLVCVCPSALPGETGPILRFSSLLDSPVADRSLIRRRVSDASDSSHRSEHTDGSDDTLARHDGFDTRAPKRRRLRGSQTQREPTTAQAPGPAPRNEDSAGVPTASCGSACGDAAEPGVPGQSAQPAQEARLQPLPAWEAAIRWDESSSESGGESSSSE